MSVATKPEIGIKCGIVYVGSMAYIVVLDVFGNYYERKEKSQMMTIWSLKVVVSVEETSINNKFRGHQMS